MGNKLINGFDQKFKGLNNRLQFLTAQALPETFYRRQTIQVAQELLGKILMVQTPSQEWVGGRILETEAYRGHQDPASHSYRGKTTRSAVMFGPPGVAYVYLIYGMYEMLNFVTEPDGQPGAVLIRALEPLVGQDIMIRQNKKKSLQDLASGPGRLCRALGIQRAHHQQSLRGPSLFVLADEFQVPCLFQSPRVGIRVGRDLFWRFWIAHHPGISLAHENQKAVPVE